LPVFLSVILFYKKHVVRRASPQRLSVALELMSIAFITYLRVIFFLSAIPLDSSEYGRVTS